MRKVNYVSVGLSKILIATNEDYWLLLDRLKKTTTEDAVLGISIAVTAKAYELYLDLVADGMVNPRDYEDTRLDIGAIVEAYIFPLSNSLSIPYKDLKVVSDEVISRVIRPYDSASNVFYNKITDTTKPTISLAPTISSEVVYDRIITIVNSIATNRLKYDATDLTIYSNADDDSVKVD